VVSVLGGDLGRRPHVDDREHDGAHEDDGYGDYAPGAHDDRIHPILIRLQVPVAVF
jgi:hypothetical protein